MWVERLSPSEFTHFGAPGVLGTHFLITTQSLTAEDKETSLIFFFKAHFLAFYEELKDTTLTEQQLPEQLSASQYLSSSPVSIREA